MNKIVMSILFCAFVTVGISAQTTAFTFQGSLQTSGSPANGNYDFEFKLFDLVSAGAQQGSTLQRLNVAVANGIFTVSLDFGAGTLPGADRFLDIAVRTAGGGAFTPLSPRQKVNSAPYSVKSLDSTTADTATNAAQLGGVAANQYVVTTDPRMTDARPPTAGSANYIQNQNAGVQAASNFNISGNGTAGGTLSSNIINATTQYNLGGSRILRSPGTGNLFAGFSTGVATTGVSNSFFGASAGQSTTTGEQNSFFGNAAGLVNVTGSFNSYFGRSAGLNSTASSNSFFGYNAGALTTFGANNSFFGRSAGQENTSGNSNAFFGSFAGLSNTIAQSNSFFGSSAGESNTTGSENSFFGRSAGLDNVGGSRNSFFGRSAGVNNNSGNNNSFFGQAAGRNNVAGSNNTFFGYESGALSVGNSNAFYGTFSGQLNTGSDNSLFGYNAGQATTTGISNAFFGTNAGLANTIGANNTMLGSSSNVGSNNLSFASAVGSGAVATTSNRIQLGRDGIDTVSVGLISTGGPSFPVCWGGIGGGNVLGNCSSSLRYKTNITRFASGISFVKKLRPITFDWKEGGMNDVGFGAEDIAKIDPRFVVYNNNGEVEGVKYDRLSVVFANALKEQQTQIEKQQTLIEKQQAMIEQLEKRLEQLEKKENR